jgi:hypothetical protein
MLSGDLDPAISIFEVLKAGPSQTLGYLLAALVILGYAHALLWGYCRCLNLGLRGWDLGGKEDVSSFFSNPIFRQILMNTC